MSESKTGRFALIGSGLAALAASLCCLGPLALVMLGIGGAWAGSLAALEPLRPRLLGVAVIALLFAWKKIYRSPAAAACAPGSLCAMPHTYRVYKVLFWAVVILVATAAVFPYLAPLFY